MNGDRGFTLLEVMVALLVLGVALPVLLGLRNFDLDLSRRGDELTAATMLAQEKLLEAELQSGLPVGEIEGEFQDPPFGAVPGGPVRYGLSGHRWKRVVAPTPLDAVREVRILVSWRRGAREESLEVSTYVFEPPRL